MVKIHHQGRKVIWIKTPKTAGTSIQWAYLFGNLVLSERWSDYVMTIHRKVQKRKREGLYLTEKPFKDKIIFLPDDRLPEFRSRHPVIFRNAFKFMVARNPWDKFVSGWKYLESTKNLSLTEVLEKLPEREQREDWIHLTKRQSEFVCDKNGELIINQVLKYEDLENDFRKFNESIGLPKLKLPKLNQTPQKDDFMNYFDAESFEKVYRLYQQDFHLFDYDYQAFKRDS